MDDFDEPIALSNGFFQQLAANNYPPDLQPVLQILESRIPNNSPGCVRLRLSDGLFSYSSCIGNVLEQLTNDGFLHSKGIIRVTNFTRTLQGAKPLLSILEYQPLQLTNTTIGAPHPHSGDPNEFKGIENYPVAMKPEDSLPEDVKPPVQGVPSPSRKRGFQGPNAATTAATPSKRQALATPAGGQSRQQNTMPSGGVFGNRGGGGGASDVIDIKLVTPYLNTFRICGIASSKEASRTINTKRGPSTVFNFVLTDQAGDAIRIACFGAECEKNADLVENGQAYYLTCQGSNTVRQANRKFNTTGHTYEITLNSNCVLEPCRDRQIDAPALKLNIIPLIDIKDHPNECVDVLAVIDKVDDVAELVSRATQKPLRRRNVTLIDQSCTQVVLTVWNEEVDKYTEDRVGEVLGIKGASVREFNGGFSLSVAAGTTVYPAPDGENTVRLYEWYEKDRPHAEVGTLTVSGDGGRNFEQECRTIYAVTETDLSNVDRGMFVTMEAFINTIRAENATYMTCASEGCKKKVTPENNQYRCPNCGVQDTHGTAYMLRMEIADFTGLTWITLFNEPAVQLLGMPAAELMQIYESDRERYDQIFHKLRFCTFEFRMRASMQTYNDQQRLNLNCLAVRPVSTDRYNNALRNSLNKVRQYASTLNSGF